MATPAWRRRWDARRVGKSTVLVHDKKQCVIVIDNGLSDSSVRRLFDEAARVYGYGNTKAQSAAHGESTKEKP